MTRRAGAGLPRRTLLGAALAVPGLAMPGLARAADRAVTLPIASNAFAAAGLRLMKQLGLFEREGLSARIPVMDSGSAALAALLSRSAEGAEAAVGELIAARARGQDVVAVADLYRGFSGSMVVAAPVAAHLRAATTAPTTERLKALDGLLIAAPSATSIYTLAFRQAAEAAGARLRLTYIAQPAMGAAMESGAIEGMACAAPFWTGVVSRDKAVMWLNGPGGDVPDVYTPLSSGMLLMRGDVVRSDPDLIRRLRAVVDSLGDLVTRDRGKVEAAAAALYPDLEPGALQLMLRSEVGNLRTPSLTVNAMRHEVEYLRSSGTAVPNLSSLDPATLLPQS